jgi:hypothetical protein
MATIEEQRRRHDLHAERRATFAAASADELMTGLAPPGWSWDDVATRAMRDGLSALEERVDAKLDVGFAAQESKFSVVESTLVPASQRRRRRSTSVRRRSAGSSLKGFVANSCGPWAPPWAAGGWSA